MIHLLVMITVLEEADLCRQSESKLISKMKMKLDPRTLTRSYHFSTVFQICKPLPGTSLI